MGLERFELKPEGIREILTSPGVLADVAGRAKAVAAAAGPGFASDAGIGPHRARAAAFTASREAAINEAKNRTLLRALGAAR
jgi:hypothetical protein